LNAQEQNLSAKLDIPQAGIHGDKEANETDAPGIHATRNGRIDWPSRATGAVLFSLTAVNRRPTFLYNKSRARIAEFRKASLPGATL
jgi:hypothetical protein